jgi:hypothetical protein
VIDIRLLPNGGWTSVADRKQNAVSKISEPLRVGDLSHEANLDLVGCWKERRFKPWAKDIQAVRIPA